MEKYLPHAIGLLLCWFVVFMMFFTENTSKNGKIPQNTPNCAEIELFKVKYDSIQRLFDSISDEQFSTSIMLNRYEMAYRIFLDRNPKAAEQYGTIISDETE